MELLVCLCADTEDNSPNYLPGWSKAGSDYEKNPAIVKWTWTKYWNELSNYFDDSHALITWLIRVDNGPVYDQMLTLYKSNLLELKRQGNEIGIHIHTYCWNTDLSRWVQTKDPIEEENIVSTSILRFKTVLGFNPLSARMGWNAMSNSIMKSLDDNNIIVDASALPNHICQGKFGERDNIYDWSSAPRKPYHPSNLNYRDPGNMRILEIPITTLDSGNKRVANLIEAFSGNRVIHVLANFSTIARKVINPSSYCYISPWWSLSNVDKMIREIIKNGSATGRSFIVGYFHPSDILNPQDGSINQYFKKNILRFVDTIKNLNVDVKFTTLSKLSSEITS